MDILIPMVLIAIAGFYVGRLYERIEWNKLIQKGVLPKPRNLK